MKSVETLYTYAGGTVLPLSVAVGDCVPLVRGGGRLTRSGGGVPLRAAVPALSVCACEVPLRDEHIIIIYIYIYMYIYIYI